MKNTYGLILITALSYALLGALGLALAIPPGYANPVFPAAGLAVALALCFGSRIFPGIWFGSLAINLAIAWQNGNLDATSVVIAAVVASGAVLQTWAARLMVLRWLGDKWRRLDKEKDIARFLIASAPLPCFISATISTCTLYLAGVIPTEEIFNSWWNWWTGDTLGTLIFTPLTLIVLFRADAPWKERRRTVAIPILVTLGLVVAAFLSASHWQQNEQRNHIEEHGRIIAQSLSHRLVAHQEALAALKRLIEVMPDMTFQQFEYFTKISLQDNSDIFAFSFNPYIPDSSRSAFEHSMGKVSKEPFRITERNRQKQLLPAPKHPFYVPVGFIAPLEGNRPAVGFNINSEPIRRNAIERAFTSKQPTVTAPIQLVQDTQTRVGVLALCPAYRRGEAHIGNEVENLIGFAVGVFKIDEMVQIATLNRVPVGLVFRLTDPLSTTDSGLLFQSDGGIKGPIEPYTWRTQLTVADRQWQLEVFPTESYLHQQRSVFAWAIGIVGLFFSALLQVTLLAMTGRASIIQQKVNEQTLQLTQSLAEVKKSELVIAEKIEKLELVLEGAQLGTWTWNIVYDQFEFNERFCMMLGYKQDELKHHLDTWNELLHPDDAGYVSSTLKPHLTGATPFFSTEHRLRHKSGRWVWVHNTGKVLQRDAAGNPLQAFGIHMDITENKEAAMRLAKAKEASDNIIRKFLDTLIVVGTDLKIIRVNQATCELLGFNEKELVGRVVGEIFHDTEALVQSVFAFYKGPDQQPENKQELRNVELCYRHKNGDRLPMLFNISLLQDDDGTVAGVVAGAKDVSSLRLAVDKIARQKNYIETLFDIVPGGLVALSPSQEVVKHNLAFDLILDTWSERLGLRQEECARDLVTKVLEQQAESDTFTVHIRRDDTAAYFRCRSTVVSVLEGIASVISIEDITDVRKAEEAMELLVTVIEQTDDAIIIAGIDEVVHYINPAAIINSGLMKNELIGPTLHVFTNGLLDASTLGELRNSMAKGHLWHGHVKSRRQDGSFMEEDVTISPISNEVGELTHFVAVKRDVTKMTLLQRQLLQAQKLEAIGQLAAGIAHEINTPMQYVQNNVSFFEQAFKTLQDLLVEVGKTERSLLTAEITALLATIKLDFLLEEIPESIKETHDGIDRVVKIVSAMKEFSHPGGNDKVATDLNRALDSTITVCRNEWKYVAEMLTDFDPDLPLVHCFPDQLNQVVLNLIINASHAIQDHNKLDAKGDSGRITIGTRKDGTWVEIQISDSGGGIPEEIQQRIFEPFFTTKEVGRGTGQGLALAHDIIVNKHGGRIDFISTPGQGTTFLLRLPIAI